MEKRPAVKFTKPVRPSGWGARYTIAILGFWSFAVNYAMRFNLSLAIVAMVQHSHKSGNTTVVGACVEAQESEAIEHSNEIGEFDWTEAEQGLILGSFFWGYTITQLPGGLLSQRFGGKWIIGIGLAITALLTFMIPVAARAGKIFLIIIRVFQGLAEGVTVPSMQVLLSKWLPPEERSRLATVTYSGISVGSALTMVTTGYLIEFFGWPAVFYGIGALGLVWFAFWSFLVFDSPASHPRISEDEVTYIVRSIGEQSHTVNMPTPWRKILTSLPVLAIFAAQISNAWGLYTLLTELPTYLRTVLGFDMEQNSWVSASPHICMWIFGTFVTYYADILIETKKASVICMRKVCNSIAQWGTALALIATAVSGCDRLLAVISLNLSLGMLGAGFGGFVVNSIDIAPNHAGVIMGIGNSICNLCGFAAPYVAGQIISGDPSLHNWRIVFFLAAAFMIVGNTIFVVYASGKEMPWNRPEHFQAPSESIKVRRFSAISETMQLNVG